MSENTITRYAEWLPRLSDKDRQYAREQHVKVTAICAAEPDRPKWLEIFYRWTVAAIDAENPAVALREAVATEPGDPAETCRALAALSRTSREWTDWYAAWHPSPN
jgi:hypothetical protein